MSKRCDIHKILVIGSGPIVIGQAAEFDYAGTQSCLALKEEGYEVVLINSNPATIMTDKTIVDKLYMEPLTLEFLAKIIRKERPDALLPSFGGQTAINLVMELQASNVLEECNVEVLATSLESIQKAEDREFFKKLCIDINEPVIESEIVENIDDAFKVAETIGYPVILRPAFTLGGTGGGFCENYEELQTMCANALALSPVHQVLIEKSIKGYKEIEYEVIRDKNDNAIIICNMENINPVGVHTGDSIVVAPSQTLTNKEYQMLRNCSLNLIRELKIEGGCNVQLALDPDSNKYYVIEVNPRVSRSSALASKATGYPIAYVSTKIAVGYTLDEIQLKNTLACFEPALDYIVTKIARFPFDKFPHTNRKLSTQMKATGEVMAVGRTLEESLLKAVRSLEIDRKYPYLKDNEKLAEYNFEEVTDQTLFEIFEALRMGMSIQEIATKTKFDKFFLNKFLNIVKMEQEIATNPLEDILLKSKKYGFSDEIIAKLQNIEEKEVKTTRQKLGIKPTYKMIDSCSAEFGAYIPYFYATYGEENESIVSDNKKVLIIGSGPIRIGQGVEFDYSTVHAIKTLKEEGYEAIVINSNPETVSTDYTISDKLYFEPLTKEDVLNVIELEKPDGVIIQLGGQTPLNLIEDLAAEDINILGTSTENILKAEDREQFEALLEELNISRPLGGTIIERMAGEKIANKIGYPVLLRPSFVLGGRNMKIVNNDSELAEYLQEIEIIDSKNPVLIDKYIKGKELEIDAVCDGKEVFIPGILEHIEGTGVHSGDSTAVYPNFSISKEVENNIIKITRKLALALEIKGLCNIQFIVDANDDVHIIELNPRSSRSVPFISKVTNFNLPKIATNIMLGKSLKEQGINPEFKNHYDDMYYVKAPCFSFSKIEGLDTSLSPEMKSTGEAIGYDKTLSEALYKAYQAANMKLKDYGTVFLTADDNNKEEISEIARKFFNMGFNLIATENTANYFKEKGLKVKVVPKLSEGSNEILDYIQKGYIKYIVNIANNANASIQDDGYKIRIVAAKYNVVTFTNLEAINVILKILEKRTIRVNEL